MSQSSRINNTQMTHRGSGFQSVNPGPRSTALGFVNERSGEADAELWPVAAYLKQMLDASPYACQAYGEIALGGDLAGVAVRYPHVMYKNDRFGQPNPSSSDARTSKKWRMYIQRSSNGTIWFTESNDGLTWDDPTQLDVALFPATANDLLEGFQPQYDEDGIVTVSGTVYPWAAIGRDKTLTTGDATDMYLYYSADGITWLRTQMANHDVSGDPFVEVASSLGQGAAFIGKTGGGLATFAADQPRTFQNAPGDWWAIMKYSDAPGNAGDTVFGASTMAMNSSDAADYAELGHFANYQRNALRQVGENSYGQNTKAQLHHVIKYKDFFIGLVQLYYHEGGGAVLVKSGVALALSRDGLHFDYMGPLYDIGLTHMLNDRTPGVNATNMESLAFFKNIGEGDGSAIVAGSVVMDPSGNCFGRDGGSQSNWRHAMRIYTTEDDSGKILMSYI